ncbi:MAG TPA: hypothetical protein VHD56_01140 [Tepidisphaeraceae bacterium]|nr:hypothetical protein [Tepidisphaeraceae bacterium]
MTPELNLRVLGFCIFLGISSCARHSYQLRIIDSVTHAPLPGVWISAFPERFDYAFSAFSGYANKEPSETSVSGMSRVSLPDNGNSYNLTFQKKGYLESVAHINGRNRDQVRVISPGDIADTKGLETKGDIASATQVVDIPMIPIPPTSRNQD